MRLLVLGAGGVGSAVAKIAARRPFLEHLLLADYDLARAERAVAAVGDPRLAAAQLDASDEAAISRLLTEHRIDAVLGATDPRFTMPIFRAALAAGTHYLDMAMSLSRPHPLEPFHQTGVKLGDDQFAMAADWERAGRLALVGMGVEPGLSDVLARYASDHLFSRIDLLGVRDGANLEVLDEAGQPMFAPTFSIWTTIEECLNPPVIFEAGRGWYTTEPFSEPEIFDFPEGIGPVECVNVEHEEVLLMPRWLSAGRVDFKYGLGAEFIGVLRTLHRLGLDSVAELQVGAVRVSPRDVVAAALPDPAQLGERMRGKTCAGVWVRGQGMDGQPRSSYLYHVVDNEWSMAEYGCQAVLWQTAVNPVVALELIAGGVWSGVGVLGPEAFDAAPFLRPAGRRVRLALGDQRALTDHVLGGSALPDRFPDQLCRCFRRSGSALSGRTCRHGGSVSRATGAPAPPVPDQADQQQHHHRDQRQVSGPVVVGGGQHGAQDQEGQPAADLASGGELVVPAPVLGTLVLRGPRVLDVGTGDGVGLGCHVSITPVRRSAWLGPDSDDYLPAHPLILHPPILAPGRAGARHARTATVARSARMAR